MKKAQPLVKTSAVVNRAFAELARKGVTQKSIAHVAGCTTSFLSQLKKGASPISAEKVEQIANALGKEIGVTWRQELLDAFAEERSPKFVWEEVLAGRDRAGGGNTINPALGAILAKLSPHDQDELAKLATRMLESGLTWTGAVDGAEMGLQAAIDLSKKMEHRSTGSGGPARPGSSQAAGPPRGEIGPIGGSR